MPPSDLLIRPTLLTAPAHAGSAWIIAVGRDAATALAVAAGGLGVAYVTNAKSLRRCVLPPGAEALVIAVDQGAEAIDAARQLTAIARVSGVAAEVIAPTAGRRFTDLFPLANGSP